MLGFKSNIFASGRGKLRSECLKRNVIEKFFSFMMFSICSTGMLYQVSFSVKNYFDYPSVVSSIIEKESADFPAVTMCPENWYNLSQVCRYFPKNCAKKDVMYRYSIPKAYLYTAWRYFGQPNMKQLFDCRMVSRFEGCQSFDCENFLRRAYFKNPVRFCFVFDALRQLPSTHEFHRCPFPWLYELQVDIEWNSTYMLSFLGTNMLPVYVHRTSTNPPVTIEDISMFPGTLVEASVSQQTVQRLPRPFRTDCEPYEAGEFRPFFGGYRTFPGCVQECQMEAELQLCNCTMPTHEYSGSYAGNLCEFVNFKSCEDAVITHKTSETCQKKCRLACNDVIYDVKLAGLAKIPRGSVDIHKSSLIISFASSNVEIFKYGQAIGSEVTFGYISGYIGVWTGVSFVGIIESFFQRFGLLDRTLQTI